VGSVVIKKVSLAVLLLVATAVAAACQGIPLGESLQRPTATKNEPPPAGIVREAVKGAFGKLPLFFEANRGQVDKEVEFLSRGPAHELFLTPTGAVLSLQKPHDENGAAVLGMGLEGARSEPRVTGVEEFAGKINYLIGDDPSGWRTNVPTYGGSGMRASTPA
jgi:hypothetical protein